MIGSTGYGYNAAPTQAIVSNGTGTTGATCTPTTGSYANVSTNLTGVVNTLASTQPATPTSGNGSIWFDNGTDWPLPVPMGLGLNSTGGSVFSAMVLMGGSPPGPFYWGVGGAVPTATWTVYDTNSGITSEVIQAGSSQGTNNIWEVDNNSGSHLWNIPAGGALVGHGSGGGSVAFQVSSSSFSGYNFNLPTGAGSPGQMLTSNGSGSTITWNYVNAGASQYSVAINGTAGAALGGVSVGAGQILQGANGSNPSGTATPALGVAGTTVGTLSFANASSGAVTLSPTTGALGSTTLTLPATTGTLITSNDNATVTNAMLAGSIQAVKLVGSDINTVGTLTTGTWQASVVAPAYGGTGDLTATESHAPFWLRYLGDGSEGAGNCSGNLSGEHWYTTFTVSFGSTCTENFSNTPLIIRATGACTIAGTINARGFDAGQSSGGDWGGSGGGGGYGAANGSAAPSMTVNGIAVNTPGSGGTSGNPGGAGATPAASKQKIAQSMGTPYPKGGGPGGQGGSSGGAGGAGGEAVTIACNSISFTGTVDVSGLAGTAGGSSTGGGGGGGGGYIILAAQSITNSGTLTVAGGSGGARGTGTSTAGGAGAAGWSAVLTIQ